MCLLKSPSFGTIRVTGWPASLYPALPMGYAPAETSWAYVAIGSVPSTLEWRCPGVGSTWKKHHDLWMKTKRKSKVLIRWCKCVFIFNNHHLNSSHFGGIISLNYLFGGIGWRRGGKKWHQKHEWDHWFRNVPSLCNQNWDTKQGLCLMIFEQYLHLSLLQLWCETKQGVRAWTITSLTKSFFLQRVSHLARLKFSSGMYACWVLSSLLLFLVSSCDRCPCRYHPLLFPTIAWWAKARSSCQVWRSCNCTSNCCSSKLSTIKKTCSSQRKSPSSPWKKHGNG